MSDYFYSFGFCVVRALCADIGILDDALIEESISPSFYEEYEADSSTGLSNEDNL